MDPDGEADSNDYYDDIEVKFIRKKEIPGVVLIRIV